MERDNIFLLLGGSFTALAFLTAHTTPDAVSLFVLIGAAFILSGFIIRFPKLLKRLRKQLNREESNQKK